MTKQFRVAWCLAQIASFVGGVGCMPSYVVVPRSGGNLAKVAEQQLTLEAVPNAWSEDPVDLGEYVTPIWVRVSNRSQADVRLVYADFSLTNAAGTDFSVMSPYSTEDRVSELRAMEFALNAGRIAGTDPGAKAHASSNEENAVEPTSDWYLAKPWQAEDGIRLASPGDGTATVGFVRFRGRPGSAYAPPYGGGIYYGPPGYFRHYGYYWSWPYYGPHFYGHHGYYLVDRYSALPTAAMKRLGLREGVLRAGAHASGFLYFRHAATEETTLDLAWSPRETNGTPRARLRVGFNVIED